jgi:hypothetical protein
MRPSAIKNYDYEKGGISIEKRRTGLNKRHGVMPNAADLVSQNEKIFGLKRCGQDPLAKPFSGLPIKL